MATLYFILSLTSTLLWLGLFLWTSRSAIRVVFGRPRRYDILGTTFMAISFIHLGYGLTRTFFWSPHWTTVELSLRVVLSCFDLLVVLLILATMSHYRRLEDMFG